MNTKMPIRRVSRTLLKLIERKKEKLTYVGQNNQDRIMFRKKQRPTVDFAFHSQRMHHFLALRESLPGLLDPFGEPFSQNIFKV
jgi:hypothetical protein